MISTALAIALERDRILHDRSVLLCFDALYELDRKDISSLTVIKISSVRIVMSDTIRAEHARPRIGRLLLYVQIIWSALESFG